MATAYIRYWQNVGPSQVQAPTGKISDATLAIGAEAHTTAVTQPCLAEVSVDAICSIDVGPNAVATTSMMRIPADGERFYWLQNGDRISVITNA